MFNLIRKLKQRRYWKEVQAERDRTHAHIEVEAYEPMEPEKLIEWSGAIEILSLKNLKLDSSYSTSYEDKVRELALLAAGLYQEIPASKHYHHYLPRGLLRHTLYMAQCIVEECSPMQYRWKNNIGIAVPFEERLNTILMYLTAALLHGANFLLSNINVYVIYASSTSTESKYCLSDFRYGRTRLFDICTRFGGWHKYRWEFRQDRPIVTKPTVSLRLVARTLCDLKVELTPPMVRALFEPSAPEYKDLRYSLQDAEHASVCKGSLDRDHFFHSCSYDEQIESALEHVALRTDLFQGAKLVDGRLFIPREKIEQVPNHVPAFDDFIDVRQTDDFRRLLASSFHIEALDENKEWHECGDAQGLFLKYGERLTTRLIELLGVGVQARDGMSTESRQTSTVK